MKHIVDLTLVVPKAFLSGLEQSHLRRGQKNGHKSFRTVVEATDKAEAIKKAKAEARKRYEVVRVKEAFVS
jgi:hypothetical protein